MSYSNFAYWYDALNVHANYDVLFEKMRTIFDENLLKNNSIADLGCGTGEMALRFAKAGFDMVCVDYSADMLSVFREKITQKNASNLLLLNQDLAELNLYGTVQGAYSVFDTMNHIPPQRLSKVFERISLFMEHGSIFVFDVNSPFKHKFILADNVFELEPDNEHRLLWQNKTDINKGLTQINLKFYKGDKFLYAENFDEYIYTTDKLEELLHENGLATKEICDGETFGDVTPETQRYLITTQKI